jgi:hypothetical protein
MGIAEVSQRVNVVLLFPSVRHFTARIASVKNFLAISAKKSIAALDTLDAIDYNTGVMKKTNPAKEDLTMNAIDRDARLRNRLQVALLGLLERRAHSTDAYLLVCEIAGRWIQWSNRRFQ